MKSSIPITCDAANTSANDLPQIARKIMDETEIATGNESVVDKEIEFPVREGEEAKQWFRADRAFCISASWYFSTRERIDVGPFNTKDEAESAIAELSAILSEISDPLAILFAIGEFQSRWEAH